MHPVSRTLITRAPAPLRRPVRIVVRTVDGSIADRLPGLAAEIAFWITLSLPALLVAAIATASLVGGINGADWQTQLTNRVEEIASVALTPATISTVVRPLLQSLLDGPTAGLASFAFLAAVWTASRAVRVVLTTVAIVYDRETMRAGWQDRLLGFAVTIAALIVGAVLTPLLIAGPDFGRLLDEWIVDVDLAPLPAVWQALYWPVVVLLATVVLAALYHLAIPGRSRWRGDLPGAILATSVWLAGSAGLRLYGAFIAETGSAYGPLAGPIVLLLWLWLTGFAVLLGGELNAQIDRDRPRHRGAARAEAQAATAATPADVDPTRISDPVRRT